MLDTNPTLSMSPAPLTMGLGIRSAAQRQPKKTAITYGEEKRTYKDLAERIRKITNATISNLYLGRTDRAAIVARNSIEYLELVCGVPDAGVAVATVNAKATTEEIASICTDAEARVVFVDNDTAEKVRKADIATKPTIIEFGDEFESWLELGAKEVDHPYVKESDIWTIPYTSGTTGKPKGVMLSHRARILNFYAKAAEYGCFTCNDHFLSITPMNHGPRHRLPAQCSVFWGGDRDHGPV